MVDFAPPPPSRQCYWPRYAYENSCSHPRTYCWSVHAICVYLLTIYFSFDCVLLQESYVRNSDSLHRSNTDAAHVERCVL
jgi:hypothetical protein